MAETFFRELEEDLRVEIELKVGSVAKIEFFKANPNSVCRLRFLSSLHAGECIALMNGRWFDERQLECFYWDGKTDYKVVKESSEAIQERINEFGDWLEGQDLPEDLKVQTELDATEGNEKQIQENLNKQIKAKREEKLAEKQQ